MSACPSCDVPLPSTSMELCPSCGGTLGAPPRRASSPAPAADRVLYEGARAVLGNLAELAAVVFTLGLALLYFAYRARTERVRVTTKSVVIARGGHEREIPLARVESVMAEAPLGARLFGTTTLVVAHVESPGAPLRISGLRGDVASLASELSRVIAQRASVPQAKRGASIRAAA